MSSRRTDPTLDQLLDDPMTQAMMQADHVDQESLKAMLRGLSKRLKAASDRTADRVLSLSGPKRDPFDRCRAF